MLNSNVGYVHLRFPFARITHQRFVLMLCTCACSPTWMGATTRPMSTPYLITVESFASALIASLCPIGISDIAFTLMSLSWSMIQPESSWPAFTPSTTTTPTESFSSWTTKWIIARSGDATRDEPTIVVAAARPGQLDELHV